MHCLGWSAARAAPTIGPYRQGHLLGQGQFGKVRIGEHVKTHAKVALKIVPDEKADKEKLEREIELQRRIDHKHVVRLFDAFRQKDSTVIAMELVPGGDLLEYLMSHVRLAEAEARRLFQQLVAAVKHCHACRVVHRDVKPENILLDGQLNVKLCDFGLAAEFSDDGFLTESCGSPNYAAPELLVKKCKYRGPEVDVWSCGVVLYALLCNSLPFDSGNIPDLFKQIRGGKYRKPGYLSAEAKELLGSILTVNVAERATVEGIVRHPWFARSLPPGLCSPSPEASSDSKAGGGAAPASEEKGAGAAKGPAAGARARPLRPHCREAARSCERLLSESRSFGVCP